MFYKKVHFCCSGKILIWILFSDLVQEKDSADVLHTAPYLLLLLVHLRQLLRHSAIVQLLQSSLWRRSDKIGTKQLKLLSYSCDWWTGSFLCAIMNAINQLQEYSTNLTFCEHFQGLCPLYVKKSESACCDKPTPRGQVREVFNPLFLEVGRLFNLAQFDFGSFQCLQFLSHLKLWSSMGKTKPKEAGTY